MNDRCPDNTQIAKRDYIVFINVAMSTFATFLCYILFVYFDYPFDSSSVAELIGIILLTPVLCSLSLPFVIYRANRIKKTFSSNESIVGNITDISFLLYAYSITYSFTYGSANISHTALIIGKNSLAGYNTSNNNSVNIAYDPTISKHESYIYEAYCK